MFWVITESYISFPVVVHTGRWCIVSVLYTLFQERCSH